MKHILSIKEQAFWLWYLKMLGALLLTCLMSILWWADEVPHFYFALFRMQIGEDWQREFLCWRLQTILTRRETHSWNCKLSSQSRVKWIHCQGLVDLCGRVCLRWTWRNINQSVYIHSNLTRFYNSPWNFVDRKEVSDSVWNRGTHVCGSLLPDWLDWANLNKWNLLIHQTIITAACLNWNGKTLKYLPGKLFKKLFLPDEKYLGK